MSLLAEFDPLTSPNQISHTEPSPAHANAGKKKDSVQATNKFDGVSLPFLYKSKWHAVSAPSGLTACIAFCAPQSAVVPHEADTVAKLQREKEEKERREREEREAREAAERARQEEAKAAAAAGKEPIGEDAKPVLLPEPEAASVDQLTPAPVDPELAKAQATASAQAEAMEREQAERNRLAGQPTFRFWLAPDPLQQGADEAPSKTKEYHGAFKLDGLNITLSDVLKKDNSGGGDEPSRTELPGPYTLSVSADGKRLSGRLADEPLEFELIDTSDPGKMLEQLFH